MKGKKEALLTVLAVVADLASIAGLILILIDRTVNQERICGASAPVFTAKLPPGAVWFFPALLRFPGYWD